MLSLAFVARHINFIDTFEFRDVFSIVAYVEVERLTFLRETWL